MFNPEDPVKKPLKIFRYNYGRKHYSSYLSWDLCLFVLFCRYYGNILWQQNQKELSGQPGVYKGSAGEPRWNGKLPAKADDYVQPRYVYENLVESTDFYLKTAELSVIASVLI